MQKTQTTATLLYMQYILKFLWKYLSLLNVHLKMCVRFRGDINIIEKVQRQANELLSSNLKLILKKFDR